MPCFFHCSKSLNFSSIYSYKVDSPLDALFIIFLTIGSKADFIEYAKDSVRHAYSIYPPTQKFAAGTKVSVDQADTWIYPLVQMKQFDVLKDEKATEEILSTVPPGTTIHLASGYFNLTRSYRQLILTQTQASYNILMASPRVG